MEEDEARVYDDYKFVTREELERLGELGFRLMIKFGIDKADWNGIPASLYAWIFYRSATLSQSDISI